MKISYLNILEWNNNVCIYLNFYIDSFMYFFFDWEIMIIIFFDINFK